MHRLHGRMLVVVMMMVMMDGQQRAMAQDTTTCSERYATPQACNEDQLCRWITKTNACASVCAGLPPGACAKRGLCMWYTSTGKCDYKASPTENPVPTSSPTSTNIPTVSPTTSPAMPSSHCGTFPYKNQCLAASGCAWYGFLSPAQCRAPCGLESVSLCAMAESACHWVGGLCVPRGSSGETSQPTSSTTTTTKPVSKPGSKPTSPIPTTSGIGTEAPIYFNPHAFCEIHTDPIGCANAGCLWSTSQRICKKQCTYTVETECVAVEGCLWENNECRFKTAAPTMRPTVFHPTPPTTPAPTTLGVPVYVSAYIPLKATGPSGESIWNYIQEQLMVALKITDKQYIYIRMCASSPARPDLPEVDQIQNSPECEMYSIAGNMDVYSTDLSTHVVKLIINMFGPVFMAGTTATEALYRTMFKTLDSLTVSLKGYMMDFHPPLTAAITKPNILLLLADDLGYGDVGYQACDGPSTTETICTPKGISPNIDAYSRSPNTIVFDRYYAYSSCGPSRAGMISGREPARECILLNPGGFGDPPNLPSNIPTIPEMLKIAGYDTLHIGKWHIGVFFGPTISSVYEPSQAGFNQWYSTEKWAPTKSLNCGCFNVPGVNYCDTGMYVDPYFLWEYADIDHEGDRKFLVKNNIEKFTCWNYYFVNEEQPIFDFKNENVGGWPTPMVGDDTLYVVNQFEQYLNTRDKDVPFFVALWFHNPHAPFVSTNNSLKVTAEELAREAAGAQWCGVLYETEYPGQNGMPTCVMQFGAEYCAEYCRTIKVEYYSTILELDAAIGIVMGLLESNKIIDNTFVIFYSDNGPARYDTTGDAIRYIGPGSAGGLPGYKYEFREGGLRVPAFVHFPALITENSHVSIPVGNVDLLPTFVELTGNPGAYASILGKFGLDGISMLPHLRGHQMTRQKPLGYVNEVAWQYLIFNNITLMRQVSMSEISFFDIANSGLTWAVEDVIYSALPTETSNDYVERFGGWTASYKGIDCVPLPENTG